MVDRPALQKFETDAGAQIFRIPLEVFPAFWAFAYLVLIEDAALGKMKVLIDAGSGYGVSDENLERGLRAAGEISGESTGFSDLTHILITHGHIDHFGGLTYVRPRSPAQLGIHELDRRVLTNYDERLAVVGQKLERFFLEAGVRPARSQQLMQLYLIAKALFRSMQVDFSYEAIGMRLGPFEFMHVPGHCAGHVVIRLHDVLFSGDHVLQGLSPHQAPEHLTLSTGLEHYLNSLELLRPWARQARLTLPGHKAPIHDLPVRLDEIRALHHERLEKVLDYLVEDRTISEISHALFGEVHGYNVILALEEAGAHVEYLYQRGHLKINNLDEMRNGDAPVPIRYRRIG